MRPNWDDVQEGSALPERVVRLDRADLVRYAGASGDFNIIHWNARAAVAAGLPDVIAHGMLTLALAVGTVGDWCGDPAAVVECGGRFAKPVVVPDDAAGVELRVVGTVGRKCVDRTVRVDITVFCGGEKVLTKARAVVRLA
ncbi:MaoC/PaaZ C-terminal domain-containing protein [Kutzneria buriramensis]|uniref:Acyl dehydratase n=1 Tax=Kutzneria buriramensis TaxID=1045776 RepID=A0A3E0HKZ7_9PSEU|nr:MaoC/PaaZ C-terminal domain-containing protein [Kutzneria buriramensis]REH47038.1 acyl dehydratase [Kutzneria buriramensis]